MAFAAPASAQSMCFPYAQFVKALKDRYGEVSTGKGIAAETLVIEIFTGPETFTILATRTDGMACIIAAGRGWQNSAAKPNEEET
jgi:hypothetical protein